MNYSFDYDNTLIRYRYVYDDNQKIVDAVYDGLNIKNLIELMELHLAGHKLYVVTARNKNLVFDSDLDDTPPPEEFVTSYNLPVEEIIYTSGKCKIPFLLEKNIAAHWDDCPWQCQRINNSRLLTAYQVDAPPGINEFLKAKFANSST